MASILSVVEDQTIHRLAAKALLIHELSHVKTVETERQDRCGVMYPQRNCLLLNLFAKTRCPLTNELISKLYHLYSS